MEEIDGVWLLRWMTLWCSDRTLWYTVHKRDKDRKPPCTVDVTSRGTKSGKRESRALGGYKSLTLMPHFSVLEFSRGHSLARSLHNQLLSIPIIRLHLSPCRLATATGGTAAEDTATPSARRAAASPSSSSRPAQAPEWCSLQLWWPQRPQELRPSRPSSTRTTWASRVSSAQGGLWQLDPELVLLCYCAAQDKEATN